MIRRAFLIDRDGVLSGARGGGPVPGAAAWLQRLVDSGTPFLIATNQTTSSPEQAAAELQREGFTVSPSQLHTPLSILFDSLPWRPAARVYVRGTDRLIGFLRERGLDVVDDAHVDTVVLGFDRAMTYAGLSIAIEAVLDHGARLVALHENRMYRAPDGKPEPGLGAWVRAVEYATGAKAEVIGKPGAAYYRTALAKLGVEPEHATMISDDPLGDLAGAKGLGMRTVFVLSGKYPDRAILSSALLTHQPDSVCESVAELVWSEARAQ